MAHIKKTITKKKSGRKYQYWYYRRYQRQGKKIKTHDTYIGPVGLSFAALRVAIKAAHSKSVRDQLFKPIEKTLAEQAARAAVNRALDAAPTRIGDLTASGWKAEHFDAEAQNSASRGGAEASSPASGAEEQSSPPGAENSPGEHSR